MDSLGHYRATIGLFVHPLPKCSRKTKMAEPFGGRRRLTGSDLCWGFGALLCCLLACRAAVQLNRIALGTGLNIDRAPPSHSENSWHFQNYQPNRDSSMIPLTQFETTRQATASEQTTRLTSQLQLLNEPTTWPTGYDDWEITTLAWDSPFRHGGEVWCVLVLWGSYLSFVRLRLLLASDVESNPGPVDVTTKLRTGPPEENTLPHPAPPQPHLENPQASTSAGTGAVTIDNQAPVYSSYTIGQRSIKSNRYTSLVRERVVTSLCRGKLLP